MANKYLIDTHALIWYMEKNRLLGVDAKAVFDDHASELILPMIALAEAVDVVGKNRTKVISVTDLLDRVRRDPRFKLYPLTFAVLHQSFSASAVPEMHDRLIVATVLHLQSLGHKVALLTKDSSIVASALVSVVW